MEADAPAKSRHRVPVRVGVAPVIRSRSSIERGRGPPPGRQVGRYFWEDVLDNRPPRTKARGEGAYAIYHATEVGRDFRLMYSTVISVEAGDDPESPMDDIITLEERASVEKRAFFELMDRERALADRLTARWRAAMARRLVRRRAFANRRRSPLLRRMVIGANRVQARAELGLLHATNAFLRGIVEIPDNIVGGLYRAQAHLSHRYGRSAMWTGLKDPGKLSNEQKGVVFFLSVGILLASVLLLNSVFTLLLPQHAVTYRHVLSDAIVSLLSALVIPYPPEVNIIVGVSVVGPFLAAVGPFLGKMIGIWLLYFLGDSLHDTVVNYTRERPRAARAVEWLKTNADTHGGWLLVLINTLPLVPDLLLYVFAVSGMRFKTFLGGIAIGTLVKYVGLVVAVMFVGPATVNEFLANPLSVFGR